MGGPRVADDRGAGRWRARPVPAALLRVAIVLLPGVVSLASVAGVSRLVPAPSSGAAGPALLRLCGLVVVACAVAYGVERAVRRLTPLVMLLRMSLLFPGRAPSRFRLARKACSTDVGAALDPRAGDDAAAVAERVVALLAALSAHDRHTRGHSQRVQVLAEMLARELGVSRADRGRLRWAALLHDIGKLSVSAALLTKPAAPDDDEWAPAARAPRRGRQAVRSAAGLAGRVGRRDRAAPRALRRHRLLTRAVRYGDLYGRPAGLPGRRVRDDDRRATVQAAARDTRRAGRAGQVRGEPLRRRHGAPFLAISLPRLLWASGPVSFLVQLPFLPLIQAGTRTASAALTAAGTGIVAGGAAIVIVTASGASQPTAAVAAGPGGSTAAPTSSAPAGGGPQVPGAATGTGSTTGAGAAPSASAVPTGKAGGSAPGGTGGSGPNGGGTPAPTASGLLPPLTVPTVGPLLPGAVASPIASAVSSVLPSAVTSVLLPALPSPVQSVVGGLLPGVLHP